MDRNRLSSALVEILKNDYLIPPEQLKENNWDKPLTGKQFGLSGFELAALILEFEKRTGIKIDINEKPMYALANINDILKSALGEVKATASVPASNHTLKIIRNTRNVSTV